MSPQPFLSWDTQPRMRRHIQAIPNTGQWKKRYFIMSFNDIVQKKLRIHNEMRNFYRRLQQENMILPALFPHLLRPDAGLDFADVGAV